jgi:hypothetical protein
MNTGQMILSIAGFVLLGNLIINVHKANTERMLTSYTNEAVINASGLAQSIFDEIQMKAFDEKTVNQAVSSTDSLTTANNLGPETGEIFNTDFDDVDDYNNRNTTVTLDRMGDFSIKVSISYVNNLNPQVKSGTPTFAKHIQVQLVNYNLPDTLKFDHIISY